MLDCVLWAPLIELHLLRASQNSSQLFGLNTCLQTYLTNPQTVNRIKHKSVGKHDFCPVQKIVTRMSVQDVLIKISLVKRFARKDLF